MIIRLSLRRWFLSALLFLFITALLGLFLRFVFVVEIPGIKFKNFLHAHSHVAMMGWLDLAFFVFFIKLFKLTSNRYFKFLFYGFVASVVGMLIAFPLQGYAGWSIAFSTFHLVLSYIFLFYIWRRLSQPQDFSCLLLKASIIFFFISSLALWAIVPIILLGFQHKAIYYIAVQHFLHFQFNGWFILAAIALIIRWAEIKNRSFKRKEGLRFLVTYSLATILSFALAVSWTQPYDYLFWINSLGVLVQLLSLYYLLIFIKPTFHLIAKSSKWIKSLLKLALASYIIKILAQSLIVIPDLARVSYTIRNFIIAFIHLILIGVLSFLIFAIGLEIKFLRSNTKSFNIGMTIFITGFLLTEFILFVQGFMLWKTMGFIPYYYELIFLLSILLPLGIGIIIPGQLKQFQSTHPVTQDNRK